MPTSAAGLFITPGRPTTAPHRLGTSHQSSRREGRIAIARPITAPAPTIAWGDRGELLYEFGGVRVATIAAGSLLGHTDLATFIFAQRSERGFALNFEDENGGQGELGEFERPLSLLELIVVIDGVLLRQAPYDVADGDWRSGYLADPSMTVRVSSPFYAQLSRWYEQAVSEWLTAHRPEQK